MSNPETLTIVSPVRNGGEAFHATLRSLTELPRNDRLRLLISDNCSQDGSPWMSCLGELAHLRPEVIRPQDDLDRVAHWDYAYRSVQSGWIKPLFAGDRLLPEGVARLLEETSCDATPRLLVGGLVHVPPNRPRYTWIPPLLPEKAGRAAVLKTALREGNIFGAQLAQMFHRETVEHLRHPTGLAWAADYWLSAEMAARFPVSFLDYPLGEFHWSSRKHHEKLHRDLTASLEEYEVGKHIIALLETGDASEEKELFELLKRRTSATVTRRYLEQFVDHPPDSFVLDALPARALPRLLGAKIVDLISTRLRRPKR